METKLLERLQQNGRESWAALGQLLGLTGPAVAERVKKLEERGVIRSFTAVLDPVAVGYGLVAFVAVTMKRPKHRDAFLAKIQALPEVQECHHIAGDDDYLLKVRCRDTGDLERVISEEIKGVPGVLRTRTTISLKTVKETLVVPV
jgi:Lrp/AsnC family leucine-responsive transcriptional regulator